MIAQRLKVPDGPTMTKALNYSLKRWAAPNALPGRWQIARGQQLGEDQILPMAVGRGNWLFAGSVRAGQRAAAVMSLIESTKLNSSRAWYLTHFVDVDVVLG